MKINEKIRPPLSDGERIKRLERTAKFQSITIFLMAVSVLILSWRMYNLIRLNSDSLLLVNREIHILGEQMDSVCNILQKLVSSFI